MVVSGHCFNDPPILTVQHTGLHATIVCGVEITQWGRVEPIDSLVSKQRSYMHVVNIASKCHSYDGMSGMKRWLRKCQRKCV